MIDISFASSSKLIDGQDFTGVDMLNLSFSPGSVNGDPICTRIAIIDDDAFEKDEHFYVHIDSEENVVIEEEYAPVYIHDNDGSGIKADA